MERRMKAQAEYRTEAMAAGFRVQPNDDRTRWVVWRSIWNPVGSRESLDEAWKLAAVKARAWKKHLASETLRRKSTSSRINLPAFNCRGLPIFSREAPNLDMTEPFDEEEGGPRRP